MVKDIIGKRILLFSPAFFNYEYRIADKMRDMGADVDLYDVRSVKGAFQRALLKVSPLFFYIKSKKYYEQIIDSNRNRNYDYILIVKCDMTPISILKKLRVVYPNARLCLYLWDSVNNIPGVTRKFKYFDTIHSFDLEDCKNYPIIKFRPLFFCDQFRKENKSDDYKYDICFTGTVHSDRYSVVKQVQLEADKHRLTCYWFLYLQSKFVFYFYKLTKREYKDISINRFSFEKKSATEIARVINDSRVVLDVQHPNQTGLTMRTIEMIGMNKKLITTNATVKTYDFYNENNILIIDRKNVEIPMEFIHTPYYRLPDDVYEKYSLEMWIDEVLS